MGVRAFAAKIPMSAGHLQRVETGVCTIGEERLYLAIAKELDVDETILMAIAGRASPRMRKLFSRPAVVELLSLIKDVKTLELVVARFKSIAAERK